MTFAREDEREKEMKETRLLRLLRLTWKKSGRLTGGFRVADRPLEKEIFTLWSLPFFLLVGRLAGRAFCVLR